MNRRRILDSVRNALHLHHHHIVSRAPPASGSGSSGVLTPADGGAAPPLLRCFPLYAHQLPGSPTTPTEFHELLCEKIRNAKRSVRLASLYVGADGSSRTELELLDAIRCAAENPDVRVRILLDHSRALRKVKRNSQIGSDGNENDATTTSAQACYDAVASSREARKIDEHTSPSSSSSPVHLFPVLPRSLRRLLPSPFDEVAGVFHMKVYIVDDCMIISGANLSREYFETRVDRYLHVCESPLVEWYSQLVDVLCDYAAIPYDPTSPLDDGEANSSHEQRSRRQRQLFRKLRALLVSNDSGGDGSEIKQPLSYDLVDRDFSADEGHPVAYAVPTFHLPQYYIDDCCPPNESAASPLLFRQDTAVWQSLLSAARQPGKNNTMLITMRIATAYLNPTPIFSANPDRDSDSIEKIFLTAGQASHGFRSVEKRRLKDWIPVSYQRVAEEIGRDNLSTSVYYYHRPGWTYHAKGMWLSSCRRSESVGGDPLLLDSTKNDVLLVTHGSGNFGYRSEDRDIESHLLLVLPPKSPLATSCCNEWNFQLCEFATSNDPEAFDRNQYPSWLPYLYRLGRPFL